MPATKTLPQCAHDALETAIADAVDDEPVVLWWDEGGYLEDLVRNVSATLGCTFRKAERTLLELRAEPPRGKTVWYVPETPDEDVDWFKDVENTGSVLKLHIGKLAARCFERDRLQAASLRAAFEDATVDDDLEEDDRDKVAKTLYRELDGQGGLPSLQALQTKIVLDGHDDPVRFVLEYGVEGFSDDGAEDEGHQEKVVQIRDLLVDQGVAAVEGVTDAETIVERTRRWAVAEWLVDEGLEASLLPEEYLPGSGSSIGISRPELRSTLSKTERPDELAAIYLDPERRFWHDVIRTYDEPWTLVECPVDGTLETRLWDEWIHHFQESDYETCATHARARHRALERTFGDVPWTNVWKQAIDVADLAAELESWAERDDGDVVDLYGDVENGTWQIDNAVFNLVISGEPEADLPEEHPATATLADLRTSLVEDSYLEYLSELGDLVVEQIDSGAPFVGKRHAHQFFDEESEYLQSGQSVALFIIDALRFDLAHELAESIRRELPELEVDETPWVGTLPSDTEFGKAALTPGSKFSFKVELRDGDLVPVRNGRRITNYQRRELLTNDGWSYITQGGEETGWSSTRVVYYWNDIDEAGENELTDFEDVFRDRLETITRIICEKIDQGEWDRAYILTDHGFVTHPTEPTIDSLRPPHGAEKVTRRWIAGSDVDYDKAGVLLDENTHLGYLDSDTKIGILSDPLQRFSKRGPSNNRFFHGGILPQEFVLNFITITQE
ncbi:BREX-5 system phosphatase PglZ [Natronobeatus ordinarius]|uniref:BREX-5 system phosphatase PglZ n=1 Tax=Natronobeatus ordinarius TaxID=2963433 RepID=UPI0020CCB9D8|nr:BREX-5 system phosphatase PglZ [Natronobeatus ordinarius]